jgi:hypothetical protein
VKFLNLKEEDQLTREVPMVLFVVIHERGIRLPIFPLHSFSSLAIYGMVVVHYLLKFLRELEQKISPY